MKDPVCGMDVTPGKSAGQMEYKGQIYHFCSEHCLKKFKQHPQDFLGKKREQAKKLSVGEDPREYTCPMHPEVLQIGPGSCPSCGMDLEPKEVSLEEGDNLELRNMTRRFWISLALTVPVFIVAMGEMVPGLSAWIAGLAAPRTLNIVELILATPVVLWCGWPFLVRYWQSLVRASAWLMVTVWWLPSVRSSSPIRSAAKGERWRSILRLRR